MPRPGSRRQRLSPWSPCSSARRRARRSRHVVLRSQNPILVRRLRKSSRASRSRRPSGGFQERARSHPWRRGTRSRGGRGRGNASAALRYAITFGCSRFDSFMRSAEITRRPITGENSLVASLEGRPGGMPKAAQAGLRPRLDPDRHRDDTQQAHRTTVGGQPRSAPTRLRGLERKGGPGKNRRTSTPRHQACGCQILIEAHFEVLKKRRAGSRTPGRERAESGRLAAARSGSCRWSPVVRASPTAGFPTRS